MNERGAISKRNVTVERDYYRFSFAGFHFRFSLFRASRTNSLFSSRRSLEISRFFYRNPPPPSSCPPRDIAADASTIEINGAEIELEARVNEYYTAKRRALIRCGHDRNAKWQSKTN